MNSEKKVKGELEVAVVDTLLDVVDEVARKIEEMMPGDQARLAAHTCMQPTHTHNHRH